jgi:hypothetical protein
LTPTESGGGSSTSFERDGGPRLDGDTPLEDMRSCGVLSPLQKGSFLKERKPPFLLSI